MIAHGKRLDRSGYELTVMRMICLCSLLVLLPDIVLAEPYGLGSPVGDALCDVSNSITGMFATGVATIAVCTMALMACLGRVQWSTVTVVTTGIVLLFGANVIVSQVGVALFAGGTATGSLGGLPKPQEGCY
jgi:type IV secretory pathway VirB2 component (pilin)